jgi:hypothetical protein
VPGVALVETRLVVLAPSEAVDRLVHGESVLSARLGAQPVGSRHAAMTLER